MREHHDASIDVRLALAIDLVHSVHSIAASSCHRRRRRRAWTDDHLHRQDVDESKQTARGSSGAMVPRRSLCVARAHAPFLPMHCMVHHAFDRVDADLATWCPSTAEAAGDQVGAARPLQSAGLTAHEFGRRPRTRRRHGAAVRPRWSARSRVTSKSVKNEQFVPGSNPSAFATSQKG